MKILHVVEPFSSGITTFIITLTESLPQHQHIVFHGGRVTVDKLKSVKGRFPHYVKFKYWKFAVRQLNPLLDFLAFWELFFQMLFGSYDVIHLHSAKAGFLGRSVGWIFNGRKIIYTPNGAPFLRKDVTDFKRRTFKKLEIIASKLSGQVICCGKSESGAYSDIGIDNVYINNGVKILPPITDTSSTKKLKVLSIGIFTYQKNPAMFNDIASHFKSDSRIEFCWVGDGPLRHLINEENVKVTGWVDNKGVEEYLSHSNIYLSTALWEGQPFAVIEAMNNEKCLLLHDCVGNKDLVIEGENGFLFDSTDKAVSILKDLLEDSRKIEKLGKASKEICSAQHNQLITGKLYNEAYEKIYTTI